MAASGALKKAATYADLRQVADHLVAEILDGDLYATPRPGLRHAHVASTLGIEIGGAFGRNRGGPGGWWILDEPELHLKADVVVPDLAGWLRSRLPAIPDAPALSLPPDWICEVISRSTEAVDRGHKLAIYLRERVGHVWLINPTSETLEVLAHAGNHWAIVATHAGATTVRAAPFEAVELDLTGLWATSP